MYYRGSTSGTSLRKIDSHYCDKISGGWGDLSGGGGGFGSQFEDIQSIILGNLEDGPRPQLLCPLYRELSAEHGQKPSFNPQGPSAQRPTASSWVVSPATINC